MADDTKVTVTLTRAEVAALIQHTEKSRADAFDRFHKRPNQKTLDAWAPLSNAVHKLVIASADAVLGSAGVAR